MPRDARCYLKDMSQACVHILEMIEGKSLDEYLASNQLRWAVERQLSILGEAAYQLRAHFPETVARIPESRGIISFRHVLIHGYAQVEDEVVWGIVETKVLPLREALATLLSD